MVFHTTIEAFITEGYSPYKITSRCATMLDYFLNCTIAMIRKRDLDLTGYPVAMQMLQRLVTSAPKYDFNGMIQRKAQKIQAYFAL